jgi:PTH1 family peptidyl-tRNA hydrolase
MKYLIFGLGNIGEEYAGTRHNIGFMVLDAMAKDAGVAFETGKRYASVARLKYKGRHFVLLKPSTYMNLSGNAVRYWMKKEKIEEENIMVIIDDIALPMGSLRMKLKGGAGGHNGLTSIIDQIGPDFPRLRIGIGSDFSKGKQVDYVLGEWNDEEEAVMAPRIKIVTEMIKSFGTIGAERTMNFFNKK